MSGFGCWKCHQRRRLVLRVGSISPHLWCRVCTSCWWGGQVLTITPQPSWVFDAWLRSSSGSLLGSGLLQEGKVWNSPGFGDFCHPGTKPLPCSQLLWMAMAVAGSAGSSACPPPCTVSLLYKAVRSRFRNKAILNGNML